MPGLSADNRVLGAPFWTESVLRIGQDDPILQFGIMTASSCIENLSSPSRQAQAEFYHNYNVAIRKVSEAPSPPPLESTMAIIGLLTCCELRNGSINSGLTHLRAGFNIAREYLDREGEEGKSDNPTHRFLTEQCLPLLAGFAFQAQLYGCQLLSDGQLSDYSDEGYVLPQIPDSFASIQQAHHCLGGILHHLALFGSAVGCAWDWQLIRKLGKLLASWSSALDTYEHRIGASQWEADRPSLGMLRCNFDMALNLMLGLSLEINSKAKSPQRWQSLLQGVPGHVKALKIEDALRDGLIHSEVECIPSLFIVILGTVSGNASDDALRILEGWDRREGNWTAAIAARTARLIIDQAQDDIPGPEHAEWEQLPVCLHHASFQFPISRVLHWLHRPPFAESVLARCLCRQGQMVPRHNSLNTRTVQQVPCGVPG